MNIRAVLRCDLTENNLKWDSTWLGARVAGLPLLKRHLLAYHAAGVQDVFLVRFPQDDAIEALATRLSITGVQLRVTTADRLEAPVSRGVTIEQRADTWVDPRLIARVTQLAASGLASAELVDVHDGNYSADARSPYRVGTPGDGDVSEVSEPALPLCSLGLTIRANGSAEAPVRLGVGRYFWHRVWQAPDVGETRRKVFFATIKPTDGIYAKMNRRVSIPISTVLAHTCVTPNVVTLLILVCSAAAGLFFAGGYWHTVAGSFLSWVASMLDGVDGELARAKFQATRLGRWLEMVCDYLYYVFVFTGMGVGLYRETADPLWLRLGVGSVVGVVLSFIAVAWWRTRHAEVIKDRDPGFAFQQTVGSRASNPLYSFLRRCTFLATRAALPYYIIVFTVLGQVGLLLACVFLGANLAWMLVLYALRIPLAAAAGDRTAGRDESARPGHAGVDRGQHDGVRNQMAEPFHQVAGERTPDADGPEGLEPAT